MSTALRDPHHPSSLTKMGSNLHILILFKKIILYFNVTCSFEWETKAICTPIPYSHTNLHFTFSGMVTPCAQFPFSIP